MRATIAPMPNLSSMQLHLNLNEDIYKKVITLDRMIKIMEGDQDMSEWSRRIEKTIMEEIKNGVVNGIL